MTERLTFTAQLWFFVSLSTFSVSKTDTWNQGCYHLKKWNQDRFAESHLISSAFEQSLELSLVPCAKHCWKTGAKLVAVREGISCMCLNNTNSLERVADQQCNAKCAGVQIALPCGGREGDERSLYSAAGPYLLEATTSIAARWVVSAVPQTLQATGHLASLSNCLKDGDGDGDGAENSDDEDWQRQLHFVWEVGGSRVATDVTACTPFPEAHAPFTFPHTGNFTIKLTVSNAVSSVRTSLPVSVLPPLPRGLQILPRGQTPRHTPSCVKDFFFNPSPTTPAAGAADAVAADWRNRKGQTLEDFGSPGYENDGGRGSAVVDSLHGHIKSDIAAAESDWGPSFLASPTQQNRPEEEEEEEEEGEEELEDRRLAHPAKSRAGDDGDGDDDNDKAVVAAFAGERLELWAGVSTGAGPTFQVSVVDRLSEVVVRHRFTVPQPAACVAPDCRAVVQELVFPYPSLYTVHVTASNQYGQEHVPLTVVVMDRSMGDVEVFVQEPAAPAHTTHRPVTFHLVVDTADRHNSFLYVIFGDGLVGFASLREMRNSAAGDEPGTSVPGLAAMEDFHREHLGEREQQLLTGLKLTASYGEGCELEVEFLYQFGIEGVFIPRVVIANNATGETVSRTVPSPLLVLNRLSDAYVHAPPAAAVGAVTVISLQLQPTSVNLTVLWLVSDKWNQVLVNVTTSLTRLSVVFNQTGVHRITARAGNLLGKVRADALVLVQKSVQDLRLDCQPFPPRIIVEEEVECHAQVADGSHVSFAWNFGDSHWETEVETSNLSSRASHLFLKQGVYDVSVVAANNVSSLTSSLDHLVHVDTLVRCLRIDTAPAAPGQEVFMEVTALGGTRVKFEYDLGQGVRPHHGDVHHMPPRTTALMSHVYDHPGLYAVMVYAHNSVSSAELLSHVVVQPLVGHLELVLQASAVADSSVVLLVQQEGKLAERRDLIFHLHFSDGTSIISASPILAKNFTTRGVRTVNFTAFNQVDSFSRVLHIEQDNLAEVKGASRLHHDAIVPQNYETSFTIVECPETAEVIEVDYSDGTTKVFHASAKRWSHVFSSPGVHSVEVTIYGGRAGGTWRDRTSLRSVLLVQQPIRGLRLLGPTHVGIDCYNAWKTDVWEGSHLVCQWSIGGELENGYTTVLQYGAGFRAEGLYTLGLHCHNDISSSSATVNITVSYPVTDLHVTVPVTVHSHPTPITTTIHAGRRFTILYDYGDGTVQEFDSRDLKLVSVSVQHSDWQEKIPVYNVTVQHVYADVGAYNVVVTVSNDMSSLTRRKRALVEEAIGDIEMFADVPGVVNVQEEMELTFRVVVGSGKNLKFAWDFAESYIDEPPISDGNTSVATHTYSMAGEYPVTVRVWNHLQKEPVIACLPAPVIVQDPVTAVHLKQLPMLTADGQKINISGAYFYPHDNRSAPVVFEANSDGAPVSFLFDFGDGNSLELEGVYNKMLFVPYVVAQAKHYYTSEGVFTVTVTATNALSNVTAMLAHPVYIQVPVQGPLFALTTEVCTRFGEDTVLRAEPVQGSNVTFTWKLDDQTEIVDANATVRHKYRQPGLETVEVTASNQVSNETDYIVVNVVEEIHSVNITMEKVVAAGEPVTYVAEVYPWRQGLSYYFTWDFSRSDMITKEPHVTYTYRHSGWNRVTVTAHNCHSNATSVPAEVHVVSRLAGLRIKTKGDSLVNQEIEFSALTYQGDFVNFTWDFGDGTPPVRKSAMDVWHTKHMVVKHTYNRTGEYVVSLLAENPLGNDTVKHRLFVLTRYCKPPSVAVVGLLGKADEVIQVWKWQVVRVESQVTLNCSASGDLTYEWRVHSLRGRDWSQERTPVEVDAWLLHHPVLLLPPHTLPLGFYVLTLKVLVNGLEIPVYQELEVRVAVIKTPLRSIIRGGVLRQISRHSTVVLDGTSSKDPDDETSLLNYTWTCRPLSHADDSCFNQSLVNETELKLDAPRLEIDASWFTLEEDFLFNLTVSTFGSEPAHTTQLVQLEADKRVIPLTLECKQCQDSWINANDKVSLLAGCHGDTLCNQPGLRFQWKVSVVEGDDPEEEVDLIVDAHSDCVMADGSSYKLLRHPNTTAAPAVTTAGTTTGKPLTTPPTTAARRLSVAKDSGLDSGMDASEPQERLPLPPWQDLEENHGPRSRTDTYRRGESSRNSGRVSVDFYPNPAEGSSGAKRVGLGPLPVDIGEGTPEGGLQSRNLGGFPDPVEWEAGHSRQIPTGPVTRPDSPSLCNDGDVNCRAFDRVQPPPPHITRRSNSPVVLKPSHVASEPESPTLVLRPGTLKQGLTYLVQVTVSDPDDPDAEGMAMTYFRVNKSPRKGACSVLPTSGVEMDTLFNVFCKEWQDEQLPVWYEVSYSLAETEAEAVASPQLASSSPSSSAVPRHLIYRGLSHQITFRLPAGLPEHGRKVFLKLSIRDNWGASTSVCHIPVLVAPQSHKVGDNAHANVTAAYDYHRRLHDDVRSLSRHLETSVYRGDVSGVQDSCEVFTHLATRLNRLATANHDGNGTVSNDTLRLAEIRFHLLQTLKHMPLRDQVEVGKTLRCLLYATLTVSEIDGRAFALGVKLLEKISSRSRQLVSGWRGVVNHDVVALTVQIVSNLLQAATQSSLMMEVENIDQKRFQWTQRSVDVIHEMLTLALQDHTLGEVPLSHHTNFVSVMASHYPTHSPTGVNISKTTFHLPHNMATILNRSANSPRVSTNGSGEGGHHSHCFQARAISFQQNPFIYRKQAPRENIEVQSEVVSLDMFSCDGEQHLAVKKLGSDNNVEFAIPLTSSVESDWTYHLSRSHMNIHQFNISQSQENQYLTLLVNLAPIPVSSQPFPVTAIISTLWPPHPSHHIFRQDFPRDSDQLRIFLVPGSLNGAGTYYFGLVETSLNSGRRPKMEVSTRRYALNAWFGSCLFWNSSTALWSDQGCHIMPRTTTTTAHCRCNHLTAFGSHFELVPNDLSFTDNEHFFGLHENPVVVILVSVVLLIYIVLLVIARRADSHDLRKGGLVCLSDNNISDSQLYEVVLDTGLCQSAPTTAKISIILHGELGMSETRELISEDDRPMFDRSSRDRFLLTLPDSLGRISKVQLWHNNAGASPRWFLTQVLVRDLNTGKVQYFLCEKWFAVDEGDGRVERELVALDSSVTFKQIFVMKARQYMADFHAWGSVFTRPAHSHFTRAQRLTCCLTLLLAYMALNAVWYQRQPPQRRGEFGLLDVSWRSLAVGAICCAVVFPLHLFLAFLFRRSRASHTSCEHKVETNSRFISATTTTTTTTAAATATTTTSAPTITSSTTTPHAANTNVNSGSVSHYAEPTDTVASSQTMTTYSLLDQSILNWQSIQDWAQRQWLKRQRSTRSSAVSVKTNAQPSTQPCPTQPVQHTLLADEETDQASSGFEDAVSQATAERHRIKPASESSSEGRRSHIGEDEAGGPHICLPAWCRYVAWTLCAVLCTLSATITILYGFRFGPTKSMFWLQSLYFSFMVCVFFAQPFWIIVTVACLALKNRNNPAVFDHCCERNQVQEGISTWHSRQKQLMENSDENAELERGVRARQRSRYLRFSRPPQEKVLQESRKKLMKEKNAANFLRDVVVFVVMFTLVCVIAYGKDLSAHFMLKQSLDTILLRSGTQSFHAVQSIPDWHRWAQGTLLDALYGTEISQGLLMKDGQGQSNNVLVGHPFLRQLRVHQQPCPESSYLPNAAQLCRYGYTSSSQDMGSSNNSWVSPPGGSTVWGEMASYSAGGFSMLLNQSSKEAAMTQLQALEMNDWLDRRSRAVIVEMTVLNVPTSLFSSVVLLLELPPSGGALPSPRISSTCLFRYVTAWDNCVLACELLFVLLALVRIQSELSAMVGDGCHYFTWPWNYTQVLLCVTSMGYIICYIYRFVLVSEIVEFLRSTYYEQFISLAFLTTWDELLRSLVGLLVFLVVVTQGLRLVRYCPHLAKFAAVYRRARREVMLMAVLFCIIIGAFSNIGSLLFGSVSLSMRTTWSASLAVVALATGIYSPPDLEADGSPWFSIFSIFCSTLGFGLLTAYMVATLTHRLRVNKSGDLLVMGKCELLDYCLQQMLLFIGVRKHTPVREPEVDLPPECTLAEFEYQVEELLFRMNALAGTTNLPEKPTGYLTDSDQSQAVGDDGISSGGSEPVIVHSSTVAGGEEGRLEQRVQKIEDKLYANEPYLAQLLKLDSIGADILSQEKEKKLRSHLEMEIFRQLQMRRQETGEMPGAADASATTVTSPASAPPLTMPDPKAHQQAATDTKLSPSISSKATENTSGIDLHSGEGRGDSDNEGNVSANVDPAAMQVTSSDDSPGSERALLRVAGGEPEPHRPRPRPRPSRPGAGPHKGKKTAGTRLPKSLAALDDGPLCSEFDSASPRHHAAEADVPEPLCAARKPGSDALPPSMLKADGLLAGGGHKPSFPDAAPIERSESVRGSRRKAYADLTLAGMERSDSLRVSGRKTGMERSDSLRAGSKRHPVADLALSPMERSDSLRSAGKKPELPPKPTFAVVPVIDSRRSPKPPPLKIPTERVLYRADTGQSIWAQMGGSGSLWRGEAGGSGQLGESSSGSEQDGLFSAGGASAGGGRRSQGQGRRNLRKTKSRGKGKGAGTLTPTLLLDELSFTVHQPPKGVGEGQDTAMEACPQADD